MTRWNDSLNIFSVGLTLNQRHRRWDSNKPEVAELEKKYTDIKLFQV